MNRTIPQGGPEIRLTPTTASATTREIPTPHLAADAVASSKLDQQIADTRISLERATAQSDAVWEQVKQAKDTYDHACNRWAPLYGERERLAVWLNLLEQLREDLRK